MKRKPSQASVRRKPAAPHPQPSLKDTYQRVTLLLCELTGNRLRPAQITADLELRDGLLGFTDNGVISLTPHLNSLFSTKLSVDQVSRCRTVRQLVVLVHRHRRAGL